jgi:Holliday junction resolvase
VSSGQNKERDLARILDEQQYHVIRAPSSGSATTRDLPDLAWSKAGEHTIVAELKYTGDNVAYFGADEVEALHRFAVAFNAKSVLVARFKRDTTFWMCPPEEARETPEGNYAVDRDLDLHPINE